MERRAYPLPLPPTQFSVADRHVRRATDQSKSYCDQNRSKFIKRRAYPLPLPPTRISVPDHPLRSASDPRSTYSDQERSTFMEVRAFPLPLPPTKINVVDLPLRSASDPRNKFRDIGAYPLPLPSNQINVADHHLRSGTDQSRSNIYFGRSYMERRAYPLPLPPTRTSVADRSFGPASKHCLGKPLPQQHQPANQWQALPRANSSFCSATFRLLAGISSCSCLHSQTEAKTQLNHPQIEVAPSTDRHPRILGERLNRILRSVVEDSRGEPVNLDCEGNKAVPFPEGFSNGSNDGPNILRRECQIQEQDESVLKLANKNHGVGGERESNMETALEHQARLIDQYEAMEKAQREWEEKFRENNSSTPESCDLGNHSDVTEERDESKSRSPWSARVAASSSQDDESKPFDNMPKLLYDTGDNNQQGKTVGTSGVHGQENSPSLLKGNQEEGHKNCLAQPPHQHHDSPCRLDSPDLKPTNSFPTDVYGALPLKVGVSNKNSLYELVSHEQTHEINGVLESLKQAKLSLQRKISKLPLVEGGYTGKAIQTSPLVSKSEERFGIPVGFSGLFRLPTDLSDEATARFSFRDSTSGFSSNGTGISRISDDHFGSRPYFGTMLTSSSDDRSLATGYLGTGSRFDTNRAPSYFTDESSARFSFPDSTSGFSPNVYPGRGIPRISSGLSGANPYSGTMSSSSADNQYLSTRNVETGTRFDTERAPSAPFFERGLVSSGQYLNPPTFPISSYYQNAAPPVSFDEGLSRPHSSSTFGVPPAYHFPFHGDHTK